MKLSFHGAARAVTGSCHLVECCGRRILIDCGYFQGGREIAAENAEPFGFDPAAVDHVLLTHAHLDHCGRLPRLVKQGFRGEIVATAATFELARLVILDSAHLQAEDARLHHRHANNVHSTAHDRDRPTEPLYSLIDAAAAIKLFGRSAAYRQPLVLAPGIKVTFFDAGHILGSASILIECEEKGSKQSLLFSGDIGNGGRPLLHDPQTPVAANIVVMETTYGDRLHRPFSESVAEFYTAINETLVRGGNILVPTFALERTQDILYFLRQGIELGKLPRSLPVFLDSPMAISVTEVFRRHPEDCSSRLRQLIASGTDPFHVPGLMLTRETSDSIAINRVTGGAVILAGSGMCTGGRIRHHLVHNLGKPSASIVFVGFAAANTLARKIIDGAKTVRLFGEDIPVRARLHTINGFSAHADRRELIIWHDRIGRKQATFLVHGELSAMKALGSGLNVPRVEMPECHQTFEL